jgi:hypothetical protein
MSVIITDPIVILIIIIMISVISITSWPYLSQLGNPLAMFMCFHLARMAAQASNTESQFEYLKKRVCSAELGAVLPVCVQRGHP